MKNETTSNNPVILEQHKRFSECLFWTMQREYFDQQGINAWVNQVPFYITSNPFIATTYAKIAVRFILDWVSKHPKSKEHPFYLLELGTGSGRFSYYVIKALHEIKQEFGLDDVNIVYVMSDFTINNLEYHQKHPALLPYIEKGLVDFAIYNMEVKQPIKLLRSKVELNSHTLVNPPIVFANYIFDTISHDSFSVQNGKLYELLVSLSTDADNMKDGKPVDWQKITVDHHMNEIHGSYYNDPHLDAVLELYKHNLRDTNFLIPIGTIRALNLLSKLTNNKFLLIASDKAYSEMSSLENLGYPSMAFHGSFSMMVNFHAIGQYFLNRGDDFFPQTTRRGIKTCVFAGGFHFKDLPNTNAAIKEYVEQFSPANYFNLHTHMTEVAENCEIDVLASHLQLSCWDPNIFMRMITRITAVIKEADSDTVAFLMNNMHKIAENYYYMPTSECVLFEIGVFYHAIQRYQEAYAYYMQASEFVSEQFGLHYNLALCLHHLEKNKEALKHFKRAYELNPEAKEAKEWIDHLNKTELDRKYLPKEL